MRGVELLARREGLGLSKPAMAEALSVREQNLSRWEFGKNPPRSWDWIEQALEAMEDYQHDLAAAMVASARDQHEQGAEPMVLTYASRRSFEAWEPAAREHPWSEELRGVPVELHRAAAAKAVQILRREHGIRATVDALPAPAEQRGCEGD